MSPSNPVSFPAGPQLSGHRGEGGSECGVLAPLRGAVLPTSATVICHKTSDVAYTPPLIPTGFQERVLLYQRNEALMVETQALEETRPVFGGWPSLHPSDHTMSTPSQAATSGRKSTLGLKSCVTQRSPLTSLSFSFLGCRTG